MRRRQLKETYHPSNLRGNQDKNSYQVGMPCCALEEGQHARNNPQWVPAEIESVHSFPRYIAGSPSSSFFSPNFPNCSSPRESASVYAAYLRSHFSVSQPEATSLSSVEPRALWSLTLSSLPLNFLRLPPTSRCPLPLAQTKLPISC